ncbi:MAG: 4-hydroxy-2-oxovalerate aldolase [Candidatus Lumbricidophila eiseniae]|uniref:4-hydroxy-2-oxovalerate aldolase n=1 Tax=Candidatus Lumbricidiphila eiseniae TaxID=1969409 RepID=A0A2A6FRC4_9MICO|nr:MAG: 4-hydroxy-2-oxovalerate aldolase [Candidatus Lumbricidophila eiseniae]
MSPRPLLGGWLSDDSAAAAEIMASLGYDFVVLDIEHGPFDLAVLERFIPLLKGIGLEVLSKVLVPERGPIQQALDFGSDGVIIPHIESLEHAREVTAFAKFPPLGDRSVAGGRTLNYRATTDAWITAQNRETKCFPMVEDAGALRDVVGIAQLDTVDGLFIGPTDLSLRRNRGAYSRTPEDFADFSAVATAVAAAGKPWVLPAWSVEEKAFGIKHGARYILLAMQHGALFEGYGSAKDLAEELIASQG